MLESVIVAQRASGGISDRDSEQEVMSLLSQLGIEHLALHYLDQLSGGQKQLVGLAQSLIRQPTLLLLDEPLSALDLNYQYHVMDLVRRETQRRNIITVVVVHDINIALRHGDHILMLKDGNLIAEGDPEAVITPDSRQPFMVCAAVLSTARSLCRMLLLMVWCRARLRCWHNKTGLYYIFFLFSAEYISAEGDYLHAAYILCADNTLFSV